LTQILEEDYGYQVLHDTTVFSYNESYSLGREKVTEYLTKYPSLEVIIDLHRDSAEGQHFVTEVNGKQTANIMFFNGMSQTSSGAIASRENPNLEPNLAFSMQLKLAADEMFPGFARKNYLKAYRYNMHLAGRYALIEVGAETNTVEEVKNAMEPLAAVLNQVLQ
jgi:stage II sporulation protein P